MERHVRLVPWVALALAGAGAFGCTSSSSRPALLFDAAVLPSDDAADARVLADDSGDDDGAGGNLAEAPLGEPYDGGDGPGAEPDGPGGAGGGDVGGAGGSSGASDAQDAASTGEVGPTPPGPVVCDTTAGDRAVVLFHVPRSSDPSDSNDFYRLPFPNDIRLRNGHINLRGHPRPGALLMPYDIVDRYIKAIEADSTGFGTNQAVYFRFARDPNFDSLKQDGAVALVDISPTSPEYGQFKGLSWVATTGGNAYICNRYILVRPQLGQPLRPATTYAAVLRTRVRDDRGNAFEADADFKVMLAKDAPADADLAAAWRAYQPLRAYLADAKAPYPMAAADLAAVAVFTTEDVERPLAAIQTAIGAAPPPAVTELVRCSDPGAVSPCDDGKTGNEHTRGCMTQADAPFEEYQGLVSLPIFQQGDAPYEKPEDGGGIVLDAAGKVPVVRNERVCVSLTVPKGAPPSGGWPVVVYSHGTGGSYRSAVAQGLAKEYALGTATGGAAAPMATLGYDGVLHGPRAGGSTTSTDLLVYNLGNPHSARDNNLQAAADLLAIERAIASWTAGGLKLDGSKVSLYGHSQGGNATALAAARASGYGAVVMSGTGGTLMLSIVGKTKPQNMAIVLPFLLGDSSVDANHPVLNLIQMYFERSDPVNFARRLFREPIAGAKPANVLHIYGTRDTYAPNETQRRYAQAAGFQVVLPLADSYATEYGLVTLASPASANQSFDNQGKVTAAQAQFAPEGYDGHFVSTANPAARQAIQKFLVTFAREPNPIIEM